MQFLWCQSLEALPTPQKQLIWLGRMLHALALDLRLGQMSLRAMSMVYSTLLSLVPMLALSFAVLKGFGVHNQLEPLLLELLAPLGDAATAISGQILGFVSNVEVGVLGAVGLGVLVYTVLSLIQKIVAALSFAWGDARLQSGARRLLDYLAILMAGPLMLFAFVGAISGALDSSLMQSALKNEYLASLFSLLLRWLPLLFVTLALSFVYWFVPNDKVRWYAALGGGLVAGVLWKITGLVFTAFVVSSGNYTAIYSAFATLLLFMIWLYLNWLILLLGARIAFYIQYPEMMKPQADAALPVVAQERAGVQLMLLIGEAFSAGASPPALPQLRRQLELSAAVLQPLLEALRQHALLREELGGGYVPARPLQDILLLEVLRVARGETETTVLQSSAAQRLIRRMEDDLQQQWGQYSLADLIAEPLKDRVYE